MLGVMDDERCIVSCTLMDMFRAVDPHLGQGVRFSGFSPDSASNCVPHWLHVTLADISYNLILILLETVLKTQDTPKSKDFETCAISDLHRLIFLLRAL